MGRPVGTGPDRGGSGWATTAGLALLAVVARVLYLATTIGRPLASDAHQYHELGNHLADGLGFASRFPQYEVHSTAWRPPVLPFVLSLFYRVFGGSETSGRVVAILIGVLLVVVCHRVLRRHLGEPTATIAAALVACFPSLVANDTVPLTESLSLVLLLVLCDAVVRRRWVVAGACFGVLVLTRPSAPLLVLALVPALVWSVGWRRAAGAVAVAALVVAPWSVRNQWELGTPNVVTSNGFNLAAVYSAPAQAENAFVDPIFHRGFEDVHITQFDEADWDATLRRMAGHDLAQNPTYAVRVAARNALAMTELRPSPTERADELDGRNLTVRTWTRPVLWLVGVVGLAGVWRSRRNPFMVVLAASVATFVVQGVVLLPWPRLRAPLDLLCCIGTAVVIDAFLARQARPIGEPPGPVRREADPTATVRG